MKFSVNEVMATFYLLGKHHLAAKVSNSLISSFLLATAMHLSYITVMNHSGTNVTKVMKKQTCSVLRTQSSIIPNTVCHMFVILYGSITLNVFFTKRKHTENTATSQSHKTSRILKNTSHSHQQA